MSIVTKTGDNGTTKLMYGERVSKADLRVEAYGTLDELNSFLGLARAFSEDEVINGILEQMQRESFIVNAELATPKEQVHKLKTRVTPEMTANLEAHVQEIEAMPGILGDWALPGATQAGAAIDVARAVARRAERCMVRLVEAGEVENPEIQRYINRLSDLLWLLGRRYETTHQVSGALRPEGRKGKGSDPTQ